MESSKKDDIALFYIGTPYRAFAGCAKLGCAPREFNKKEQKKLTDWYYDRPPASGVYLKNITRFDVQVPLPLIIDELDYITNKKNWGAHFQGSVVSFYENEFKKVAKVAFMLNSKLDSKMDRFSRQWDKVDMSQVLKPAQRSRR